MRTPLFLVAWVVLLGEGVDAITTTANVSPSWRLPWPGRKLPNRVVYRVDDSFFEHRVSKRWINPGPKLPKPSTAAYPTPPLCSGEASGMFLGSDVTLKCGVRSGKTLRYTDIKKWSDCLGDQKISVDIICRPGGNLNLPWPMKAKNVVNLFVRGCRITGFFDHLTWSNITAIPDTLQHLLIDNATIEVSTTDLANVIINTVKTSDVVDCGQQSIVTYTFRNIVYDIIFSGGMEPDILNHPDVVFTAISKTSGEYTCRYPYLMIFDESGSKSRSRMYFNFLTENSQFPVLRVYNLSDNGFTYISPELQSWQNYFPCLSVLDLSRNGIQNVSFLPLGLNSCGPDQRPLVVNLQHNRITEVNLNVLNQMRRRPGVILDLRNNPLSCASVRFALADYARSAAEAYPEYSALYRDILWQCGLIM